MLVYLVNQQLGFMMTMEKAILLDKILLKFEGDKSWTWDAINQGVWKDIDPSPHVSINGTKYLIGENILARNNSKFPQYIQLTDKGAALFADRLNSGYEVSFEREIKKNRLKKSADRNNWIIQIAILVISLAALIVSLIK